MFPRKESWSVSRKVATLEVGWRFPSFGSEESACLRPGPAQSSCPIIDAGTDRAGSSLFRCRSLVGCRPGRNSSATIEKLSVYRSGSGAGDGVCGSDLTVCLAGRRLFLDGLGP